MSEATIALLVEVARSVITAVAVYSIVVGLAGAMGFRRTWHESVEAVGGLLWVLGLILWRVKAPEDVYSISLICRAWGVALLVLPRLVHVALREVGRARG